MYLITSVTRRTFFSSSQSFYLSTALSQISLLFLPPQVLLLFDRDSLYIAQRVTLACFTYIMFIEDITSHFTHNLSFFDLKKFLLYMCVH